MGRPDPTYPEGVYLLLREAPHGDFLWLRAEGVTGVVDALRRAVVRLSRDDVARLEEMVRAARVDPRDVLLWAQMEGLG